MAVPPLFGAVLLLFLGVAINRCTAQCSLDVQFPKIVLSGVHFSFTVTFPPYNGSEAIPEELDIVLYQKDVPLYNQSNVFVRTSSGTDERTQTFGPVKRSLKTGHHRLKVIALDSDTGDQVCGAFEKKILSVPGWLTIFPPLVTAVVAIVLRQVLLALVMGIWLAAFLGYGYNPLTAILRTLDTYIVDALVDHDHSAIIVATFFLSGLIGIVQRSGGGLGLANFFSRFANSTRRACLICFLVALLIFFDDYTCVLIAGNSLRMVMDKVGVSRDKFAFIVQSMAPSVASFFPISSWVGAQIGYVQSGFDRCSLKTPIKPFNVVIETMPYRFLPLLMMYCVFLVCLLNRDFGCMLTVEKKQNAKNIQRVSSEAGLDDDDDDEQIAISDSERKPLLTNAFDSSETDDSLFEGALAPKRNVPHRWFNAVVPFLIVILITFVGMVVGGYLAVRSNNKNNPDDRMEVSVTNIFGEGDALAALIWSVALAMVILYVMLALQRILSFKEYMESWIEGVKDIIEPLIILVLAWALGNVIADIQTSNFIAQVLNGNISARYIPVITAIIGYFMAYCTGSAFGTMGILFPLVIPTVCQLADSDSNSQIQTAAAILSSCIFGNLMSPIADLTVLVRVSTKCDYNSHLKTCALYVLITGFISLLFGTLPVGAGWYSWWEAWLIMPVVLTLVFIIFSTGHDRTSRSIFIRGCPCLFTAFNHLYFKCAVRMNVFKVRYLSRCLEWRSGEDSQPDQHAKRRSGVRVDMPSSSLPCVIQHENVKQQRPSVEGEYKTADEKSSTDSFFSSS